MYLVSDEVEILLKTIQGLDKVGDPPPPIDGSEGKESTPKCVIPMLQEEIPARSTEVAKNTKQVSCSKTTVIFSQIPLPSDPIRIRFEFR